MSKNKRLQVPRTAEEKRVAIVRLVRRARELALQYDKGDPDAVIDLAAKINTLVNPERRESVLKKFLGVDVKTLTFASTPDSRLPFRLVESIAAGMHHTDGRQPELEASYVPRYDRDAGPLPFVPFDQWYTGEAVFELSGGSINRKELLDAVRNKDGGAHLDTHVPPLHATVMRQEEFKHRISDGASSAEPVIGAQEASIRQVAFEVQLTIDRHLAKKLGIEMSFPAPPVRHLGSTLRVEPSEEYRKQLQEMAKAGDPNDPVTRFCARAAFYNDLSIGPHDIDRSMSRAKEQREPAVPYNVFSDECRNRNK
jgi:hypothetical protein